MKVNFVLFTVLSLFLCFNLHTVCGSDSAAQAATPCRFLLSPNGQWLAYGVFTYDDNAEALTRVMLCQPDGAEEHLLKTVPGHYDEIQWNGNDHLVCSAWYSKSCFVVPVNGEEPAEIKVPAGYDVWCTRLSPDGGWLAFTGSFQEGSQKQYGLYVMERSTGTVRRLIQKGLKTAPAWSPDSKQIAIGNKENYTQQHPLAIVDVETGRITETGIEGVGAAWSPDGKTLAFSSSTARSGIWAYGIPVIGQIAVYDLRDKSLSFVTPPTVATSDKNSGNWEKHGALHPVWSPDGKWLAYWKMDISYESKEDQLRQIKSVWIVQRDGKHSVKVADGHHRCAWSNDNQSLFLLKDTQIDRIDLPALQSQTLVSWQKAKMPEPRAKDTVTLKEPGVVVKLTRIDEAYGRAFAKILSEARKEYEKSFDFAFDDTLEMEARRNPDEQLRLWTDGRAHMYLVVASQRQLAPPTQSGVYNIYGLCHELGHIVMYSRMKNVIGLPPGVGEGWAHYAGSSVVDAVAAELGKDIWPQPYDVAATEGMARLKQQADGKDWKDLDDIKMAAKVFYEIETKYGRNMLCQAFDKALSNKPNGREFMPLFVQSLKNVTGDANAGDWIPQQVMEPRIEWKVKDRSVDNTFFADTHTLRDETGMLLCYDDGTQEGQWSITGSGHAVLFQCPEGDWRVDRIDVFGARYGGFFAPRKDFFIYLCDEDFNVLYECTRPYGIFKRGAFRWYEIDIEPAAVPRRFYVCLYFNSTASNGVYMAYDENVARSHSFTAIPWTFVKDVDKKYDWMIRPHLREK